MKDGEIQCKLTGCIGKPIRAHIIPRSLYQLDGGKQGRILTFGATFLRESKNPIGIYDSTILTNEGESLFQECDDHAARFFLNKGDFNEGKEARLLTNRGKPLAVEIETTDFDARLMKLFAISMLWRASVSSHPFFKAVDVGAQHEEKLRNLILRQEAGSIDDFSVLLARHIDTPTSGHPIMPPFPDRFHGLRFYRFMLPQVSVMIKVDKRPMIPELRAATIGGWEKLFVLTLGPFKSSKPYQMAIDRLRRKSQGPTIREE
jgi:hypothetical protein